MFELVKDDKQYNPNGNKEPVKNGTIPEITEETFNKMQFEKEFNALFIQDTFDVLNFINEVYIPAKKKHYSFDSNIDAVEKDVDEIDEVDFLDEDDVELSSNGNESGVVASLLIIRINGIKRKSEIFIPLIPIMSKEATMIPCSLSTIYEQGIIVDSEFRLHFNVISCSCGVSWIQFV
jgi:hypothetical protein